MLEPANQQYVQVGRVAQAHGIDGTVLLVPNIDAPELFDDLALVRLQNGRGDLVAARIETVRVQQKNNRLSFFIKFDHITDRNEAERLKGRSVFVEREAVSLDTDEHPTEDFTSFTVMDAEGGHVGKVADIRNNTAQTLLSVKKDHGSMLIPLVDEYVTRVDTEHKVIYCQNLNQLSDL